MLFKLMNSGSMSLNSLSRKRGKGTMFKDSPSQIFTIIEQSPVEFTRTEGVAECNDLILLACKSTHSLHMRTYTHTHTHTHTHAGSTPFMEKTGYLYKMGGHRANWKLRYFVLQPGVFTYYKKKSSVRQPYIICHYKQFARSTTNHLIIQECIRMGGGLSKSMHLQ